MASAESVSVVLPLKRTFFDFPGEIRNLIYDCILDNCDDEFSASTSWLGDPISKKDQGYLLDPFSISTRFSEEFAPVYYHKYGMEGQIKDIRMFDKLAEHRVQLCDFFAFHIPSRTGAECHEQLMSLVIHIDCRTEHAPCRLGCTLAWDEDESDWQGVRVSLLFHDLNGELEDEQSQLQAWVVDTLYRNGDRHLTAKQLREVVGFIEVIRANDALRKDFLFASEVFWRMVEGEESVV